MPETAKFDIRQLVDATVRIEAEFSEGSGTTGTGFFFSFRTSDNKLCHTIMTNKHVISGCSLIRMYFSKRRSDGSKNAKDSDYVLIPKPDSLIVLHEDPLVDLAAILFSPIYNSVLKNTGDKLFFMSLAEEHILTEEDAITSPHMQDVLMVGYPNGLWDKTNNSPISRRGITATAAAYKLNGKNEFLIDCACFPGSSGSPVYTFEHGVYLEKDELSIRQDQFKLAGILYSGPVATNEGEIVETEIALSKIPIARLELPIHLGYCIRSTEIMKIKDAIKKRGTPVV